MLELLFGNTTINKVLLYISRHEKGYARQISQHFSIPINMVQKQLSKLEKAGILKSQYYGKTRLYQWNEDFSLKSELCQLLTRALEVMPEEEVKKYFK